MATTEPALIGKYELEAKIAQGGMAEIFLARQPGLGGFSRRVVLKCILPLLAEEPRFVRMFLEEARLASQIHHPNVVQIFDVGEADDSYYIAMEYIDGLSVGSMMTRPDGELRALPIEVASEIVVQACAGLQAAHRLRDEEGNPLGLVHRDVSPQNLMVSRDGVVKLVDFGIAKAQDSSVTTRTGSIKGKYAYMSPEQVRGLPLDRRSDIFSLGTLFFELLTGQRLFHRQGELAILVAIIEDPYPTASEIKPDIPQDLSDVILKALQREVDTRFSTAAEMSVAVRKALAQIDLHTSSETLAAYVEKECQEQLESRRGPGNEFASTPSVPDIDDLPRQRHVHGVAPSRTSRARDDDDEGEWEDAPTIPKDSPLFTSSVGHFPVEPAPESPLGTPEFPDASSGRETRAEPRRSGTATPPGTPAQRDSADEVPTQPFAEAHDPELKSRLASAPSVVPQGPKLLSTPVEELDRREDSAIPDRVTAPSSPDLAEDERSSGEVEAVSDSLSKTVREDGPPASLMAMKSTADEATARPSEPRPSDGRPSAGSWLDPVPGLTDQVAVRESSPSGEQLPRPSNEMPDSTSQDTRAATLGSRGRGGLFVWLGIGVFVLGGLAGIGFYLVNRSVTIEGPPLYYAHPPSLPESTLVEALQPLADYLSQRLGRPVKVVSTPTYQFLPERLISGEIHFANLPPLLYLQARAADPNLKLLVSHSSGGVETYQSYILARSDSKILSVEQLQGHSFCYPDQNSTSGYLLPREFLRSKGYNPDTIFSSTRISGNHEAVMQDIVAGRCDAGAVSSIAWQGARDLIGARSAQIISVGPAGETAWDVVCASPKLPADTAAAIRRALLDFDPERDLGRQWISPLFTVDRFVEPPHDFNKSLEVLERAARAEKLLD